MTLLNTEVKLRLALNGYMKAEAGSLFSTYKFLPFWTGFSVTPKGFDDSSAMVTVIPLFRGNVGEGGMSMTQLAPSQYLGYHGDQNLTRGRPSGPQTSLSAGSRLFCWLDQNFSIGWIKTMKWTKSSLLA